ncbi:NUDIX hydrolase [Oceanibaculum pacificum]|nr:NUDIX hydrolase [Oceanibaculum pacificum]
MPETRLTLTSLLSPWMSEAVQAPTRQSAAVPYRLVDGQPVFLLITSRRSGRWIFPKGGLEPNLEPWENAAKEALEEAGVEGDMGTVPLGHYRSVLSDAAHTVVRVAAYPLHVRSQREAWDEKGERHRHWAVLPEAKRLLNDSEMARIADRLAQRAVNLALEHQGRKQ